ncbi:unnamed protein product, partial [Gulo gulo]
MSTTQAQWSASPQRLLEDYQDPKEALHISSSPCSFRRMTGFICKISYCISDVGDSRGPPHRKPFPPWTPEVPVTAVGRVWGYLLESSKENLKEP